MHAKVKPKMPIHVRPGERIIYLISIIVALILGWWLGTEGWRPPDAIPGWLACIFAGGVGALIGDCVRGERFLAMEYIPSRLQSIVIGSAAAYLDVVTQNPSSFEAPARWAALAGPFIAGLVGKVTITEVMTRRQAERMAQNVSKQYLEEVDNAESTASQAQNSDQSSLSQE